MTEQPVNVNDIRYILYNLQDLPTPKTKSLRFKQAYVAASEQPIATSLCGAAEWLLKHKLLVCHEPNSDAICNVLNNLTRQAFIEASNAAGNCILHPFMALAAISQYRNIDIYVFSTLTRPFHFEPEDPAKVTSWKRVDDDSPEATGFVGNQEGTIGSIALLHDNNNHFYSITSKVSHLKGTVKDLDHPTAQRCLSDKEKPVQTVPVLDISQENLLDRVHQATMMWAINFYDKNYQAASRKPEQAESELLQKVKTITSMRDNFWEDLAKQMVLEALVPADTLGSHIRKRVADTNWVQEWAKYVTEICKNGQESSTPSDLRLASHVYKTKLHTVIATPLSYALRPDLNHSSIAAALAREQRRYSADLNTMSAVLDGLIQLVVSGEAARCFGDHAPTASFDYRILVRKQHIAPAQVYLPKSNVVAQMRKNKLLSFLHVCRLATAYLKTTKNNEKGKMRKVFEELEKAVPNAARKDSKYRHRSGFHSVLRELRTSRLNTWTKARFLYDLRLVLRLSLQAYLRQDDLQEYMYSIKQNGDTSSYSEATKNMRMCDRVALGLVGQKRHEASDLVQQLAKIGQGDMKVDDESEEEDEEEDEDEEEEEEYETDDSEDDESEDDDDDDEEEDEDDDDEEEEDDTTEDEDDEAMPKNAFISLLNIAMQLCQSMDIKRDVTCSDIRTMWKSKYTLEDDELLPAVRIINTLRPFVPKSSKKNPATYDIFSCAPIHSISEHMLHVLGMQPLRLSKQSQTTFPLPLNAETLYDVFHNDYAIIGKTNGPIATIKDAKLRNDETFANFFNCHAVEHLMPGYQLTGVVRYIDVNTVLWYGSKYIDGEPTKNVRLVDAELLLLEKQLLESNKQVIRVIDHDDHGKQEVWDHWSKIRDAICERRIHRNTLLKQSY